MIDRYTLRYFLAVIDNGNFSKAAAQCHVSQPTLSVGISKLERALGVDLFLRTNRRVELTAAGARFAVHARKVEAEFNLAERSVSDGTSQTRMRLGILTTIPTAWHEAIVLALRPFQATERVEFVEAREKEILDQLSRGRTDMAVTIVRDDNGRFPAEPLSQEHYPLAMSVDHPLAREKSIMAEALADNVMIVRRNCEALADVSRHFTARGVRPFFAAKTNNDDRALSLVRSGLGITVMPSSFADPSIAMPLLSGFTLTRTIGILLAPHADSVALRASATYRAIAATISRIAAAGAQQA